MSVYHCPLCPLIFQYRTEVEWHLREEHRSRTDEVAGLRLELAAATRPLDHERLAQLRSSKAGPSVTLLLGTAPAATMTVLDVARLRQLAERARRRLAAEPHVDTAIGVIRDRLSHAVSAAESQATDRGLAVLVNREELAILELPFAPRERHVVDLGFATRDLEYALHRHPRYRVLVLGRHPRVLEGQGRRISEPGSDPAPASPRSLPPGNPATRTDPDTLVGERVDIAGALPLVVVGDHGDLERFRHRSRFAGEIVAEARRSRFHRAHIADLVAEALERAHRGEQSRTLARLLHADVQSRIAWGIRAAWNAVDNGTADRLWVEHDYAVPGRVVPGVYGVETITDPAEPGAIDDLVDALLARAAELGIRTHVLDRHVLGRTDPVAVEIPVPAPTPVSSPRSLATT